MDLPLRLGPSRSAPLEGSPGFRVRINDDARKSVVFFGVPSPEGIQYGGTGFMLADFEEGILIPYIVTARHVAKELEKFSDTGFHIRANTKDGKSRVLLAEEAAWAYHPDPTVDIAVANFSLSGITYDIIYYPLRDTWFVDEDRIAKYGSPNEVLCGDPVSIVGLFRLHAGTERNVPIVHNGHVAALPDVNERVPLRDRSSGKLVDAEVYLVEAQTLDGLSGSPVFTNEALTLSFAGQHHGAHASSYGALVLLGLYVGSWDGEPGAILAKDRNHSGGIRVPVGMGLVVPAHKIVELIRGDLGLNRYRKARVEAVKNARAATTDSALASPKIAGSEPATKADNPTHEEDFRSLLNAAAKTPSQGGGT